ncbi:hypothetical protein DPMN_114972 [Dreissena polymorpha]|uniref:Caspase family p20 domain-containing protein n=1 Tax=Dreissena polymorpha TaxID=45954 RepID=A0A9D4KKE4_DREPO|nr:hypothetical protein DPMN_114972 [Dreissena polymorpha]
MSKKALIVVNKVVNNHKKRNGATKDMKQMCWMFGELGFDVIPRLDLKAREIEEELRKACSKPCDCFVLVISSHGHMPGTSNVYVYDQTVLGSDGEAVSVDDLFKCMNNEVLKGIPKLCFIQACRSKAQISPSADEVDEGIPVMVSKPTMTGGHITHQLDQADCKTTQDDSSLSRNSELQVWYDDSVIEILNTKSYTEEDRDNFKDVTAAVGDETTHSESNIRMIADNNNPFNLTDSDDEDTDDEVDVGGSTGDAAGGGDSNAMPELPVDVAPVNCPRDCLVMYSVQPHKYALRHASSGSWMLHYMFHNRKELKKPSGNVLGYLTSVARSMANHTCYFTIKADTKEVKLCGTIYHRLTTDVIIKVPSQPTRQMLAFKAKLKRYMDAINRKMNLARF